MDSHQVLITNPLLSSLHQTHSRLFDSERDVSLKHCIVISKSGSKWVTKSKCCVQCITSCRRPSVLLVVVHDGAYQGRSEQLTDVSKSLMRRAISGPATSVRPTTPPSLHYFSRVLGQFNNFEKERLVFWTVKCPSRTLHGCEHASERESPYHGGELIIHRE